MEIKKNSLLGKAYNFWIWCDGEPRKPEDLCHFMRVCLFHWWLRWFFLSGQFIPIEGNSSPGSDTPRGITPFWVVMFSSALIAVVCRTIVNPGPWLIGIGVVSLIIIAIVIGVYISENKYVIQRWRSRQMNKIRSKPISEALSVFGQWMSAKKQRICPFMDIEPSGFLTPNQEWRRKQDVEIERREREYYEMLKERK